MKHPFDDFLPTSWHQERVDSRIVRLGAILVVVVSLSTAAAFASTMSGWRSLLTDRAGVEVRWVDARERLSAYIDAQMELKNLIKTAKMLEKFTDGIPRSLLMWEMTQSLPENVRLDDVRLETRRRFNDDNMFELSEHITLLGIAPDDSSISQYIESLDSSRLFSKVALMYAQEHRDNNRNFSIQMEVQIEASIAMEQVE